MHIPTSIIYLEEGGYILRYALGGRNGRVSPDLGLLPGDACTLDIALREITAPDSLSWQESRVQDPSELLELQEEEE